MGEMGLIHYIPAKETCEQRYKKWIGDYIQATK